MKQYVVDTNVLISFVTDRNLTQQEVVAPLFESASRSKCILICHQFVLTEFLFVMDKVYGVSKKTISDMVRDLISLPGVRLHYETDFNAVFSLWPDKIADFGDALVASTGKAIKGSIIVTFDEKFKAAMKTLGQAFYLA